MELGCEVKKDALVDRIPVSKPGNVGQGFSPAEPLSLPLKSSTFHLLPFSYHLATDHSLPTTGF
jgi:hypothetical protein